MFKRILTTTGTIIGVVLCLATSCALLVGLGQVTMDTTGAELAEQAHWKLLECRELFDAAEESLCVLTVNNRRLLEAQGALEGFADALDGLAND